MIETNSQLKGVFWDLDGTLSNSYSLGFTSTNEVLRNNGKRLIDEDEYHEGTKYPTPQRMAWHATGNPDDTVGEILGNEFDALYVQLVSKETSALFPGIFELLTELSERHSNVRFGILSNACTAYVDAVVCSNDLSAYFPVKLGADKVEAAKPAPDGLLQICEFFSIQSSSCIYIGDSPTDGLAARAANMKSVGFTWGSHPFEKISPSFDHVVHSVPELRSFLVEFLLEK
jgi:phosphoglycolate phosphatase-like HAD superfamily hydrolase